MSEKMKNFFEIFDEIFKGNKEANTASSEVVEPSKPLLTQYQKTQDKSSQDTNLEILKKDVLDISKSPKGG